MEDYMKFKDWSLKNKIIIPTFCVVALILAASTWVMTDQAKTMAVKQATHAADIEATGYGNEISETLSKALTVTRTLASIFEVGANYKDIPDREALDAVLVKTLKLHPGLSGAWVAFPSRTSYDNREEEYRDKYKGAYRNWYYRDGENIGENFGGEENLFGQSWFENPLSGNVETITEPYPWEANGKKFWLCSTGHPVKRGGKNIGVVGVDFYLNDLLETVLKIKPFETGYAFLVTNKGAIVAHPDKDLQTKNIAELVDNNQENNVENAIKNGKG
jgi:methyl-accepting chemotaxis protein